MKARAYISGGLVWEGALDCIPPIGTSIIFPLQRHMKGHFPGTILSFDITHDLPPTIDLTEYVPVLILDVEGWNVVSEGPTPPGEKPRE